MDIQGIIYLLPLYLIIPLSAASYILIQHKIKLRKIEKINEYTNSYTTNPISDHHADVINDRTVYDYIIPVVLATLVTAGGLYVTFMIGDNGKNSPFLIGHLFKHASTEQLASVNIKPKSIDEQPKSADEQPKSVNKQSLNAKSLMAIAWAFMGVYTFSLQHIFRRYVSFDLYPRAYYDIVIRTVYAVSIALVIRYLFDDYADKAAAPALYFIIGAFPDRGLLMIENGLAKLPFYPKTDTRKAINYPLSMVEGLSLLHRSRLKELGIDNVQNLAVFDYTDLLIRSPFNPETIASWIGASKLIMLFGDNAKNLYQIGIYDVCSYKMAYEGKDITLDELAEKTGIDKIHLEVAYMQIREDSFIELSRKLTSARISNNSQQEHHKKRKDLVTQPELA